MQKNKKKKSGKKKKCWLPDDTTRHAKRNKHESVRGGREEKREKKGYRDIKTFPSKRAPLTYLPTYRYLATTHAIAVRTHSGSVERSHGTPATLGTPTKTRPRPPS